MFLCVRRWPAPEQTIFEQTIFEQTIFEQTIFEQTIFEQTNFEQTIFEQTIFEQTIFEQTIFEQTIFEQTIFLIEPSFRPLQNVGQVVSATITMSAPDVLVFGSMKRVQSLSYESIAKVPLHPVFELPPVTS